MGAYAVKIDEQIQTPNSTISEMWTYLVSTGQELVASKLAIVVLYKCSSRSVLSTTILIPQAP